MKDDSADAPAAPQHLHTHTRTHAQIWSLQTGLLLVTGHGHAGEVAALSLSCDGRLLASGATDGEVRVWSMQVRGCPTWLGQARGACRPALAHPAAARRQRA
jgi:WD40 repeat protein